MGISSTPLYRIRLDIRFRGRVLSAEFVELPSRKQWPMYYTIIKKPQCLDNIFVSKLLLLLYPFSMMLCHDRKS